MTTSMKFVGGDEVIETFLLEHSDGGILDLTGLSVSGSLHWGGGARLPLSVGAEIEVSTLFPVRAVDPDEQVPHGVFRLTEQQTEIIPYGAIATLRMTVVEGGVTMSTYGFYLERVF